MKKYVLYEKTAEAKKVYEGCTLKNENAQPEVIKEYNNKSEALEALKMYNSKVIEFKSYNLVTEYYIEEEERDEEGYFIGGGDIWDFSKLPDKYCMFYINEVNYHGGFNSKKYTFEELKEYHKINLDLLDDNEDISYFEAINNNIDNSYDLEDLIKVLTTINSDVNISDIIEKVE